MFNLTQMPARVAPEAQKPYNFPAKTLNPDF